MFFSKDAPRLSVLLSSLIFIFNPEVNFIIKDDFIGLLLLLCWERCTLERKQKLLNRVSRVEDIRYPKQLLDYRPIERRLGWPLKRLLDGYSSEAETDHLLA